SAVGLAKSVEPAASVDPPIGGEHECRRRRAGGGFNLLGDGGPQSECARLAHGGGRSENDFANRRSRPGSHPWFRSSKISRVAAATLSCLHSCFIATSLRR